MYVCVIILFVYCFCILFGCCGFVLGFRDVSGDVVRYKDCLILLGDF